MDLLMGLLAVGQCLLGGVPLVLTWRWAEGGSGLLLLAAIAAAFVLVAILPVCKGRENLMMFLLVAVDTIPVNLRCTRWLMQFLDVSGALRKILWSCMLFYMLFSLEELTLGIVTRFLWRRQKKNIFSD